MSRKIIAILVFLLLCSFSTFLSAKPVSAEPLQYDDFTILANGSIYAHYPISPPVITSDNVTYTLTRNVTLSNWIRIERNNTILDGAGYILTNMQPSPFALELEGVSNVTVRNLNFRNSGRLRLVTASDCVLVDNNFTDCPQAFFIQYSSNMTLIRNTMKNTSFGYVYGDSISHYLHTMDTSNTVDGKPVYYLTNQKNLTVNSSTFPEIGYLALVNSTDITVEGLTLANRTNALLLSFTNNSKMVDNIIENNIFGILLVSSSNNLIFENKLVGNGVALELDLSSCNNTITENRIDGGMQIAEHSNNNIVSYNNVTAFEAGILMYSFCSANVFIENRIMNCSGEGIWLVQSQNNTFIKNTVMNTTRALRLEQVETCNNTFFDNNFEDNRIQVFILGTIGSNVWDNGFEGNFWGDYNRTDSNQDGIGDAPYIIDENNTDHYPLMGTFQSFNVSITPQSSEEVDVISNFTISDLGLYEWLTTPNQYLQAGQPFLRLILVQGQNMTAGFCRMTLPNNILNTSEYIVLINMTPVIVNKLAISNGTHTILYFTFNSSALDGIIIIPEFPSFLVLPLFMVAMLLPIAIYERRHRTRALKILKRIILLLTSFELWSPEPNASLNPELEWTGGDLNPRPPECKSGVHTN
jgi:parallel beta-helix repeat protein